MDVVDISNSLDIEQYVITRGSFPVKVDAGHWGHDYEMTKPCYVRFNDIDLEVLHKADHEDISLVEKITDATKFDTKKEAKTWLKKLPDRPDLIVSFNIGTKGIERDNPDFRVRHIKKLDLCLCQDPRTVWNGTQEQWICDECGKRIENTN